jgi:hypothetical protein
VILLISASWVARITGVSHWSPFKLSFVIGPSSCSGRTWYLHWAQYSSNLECKIPKKIIYKTIFFVYTLDNVKSLQRTKELK